MKAIEFPEQNVIFAKDQPQYNQLPAHRSDDGIVTFAFELDEVEKAQILLNGVVWVKIMTFNQPLQPILVCAEKPEL